MDRFPDPDRDNLRDDERAVLDRIVARRGKLPAPFVPLLRSPEVADLFEQLSTRLWARLPPDLLEAVFLMVAVRQRCGHQWDTHVPKALAAGLSPDDIATLGRGAPLADGLRGEVTGFVHELLETHVVGPARYDTVKDRLSERGVVELTLFCGLAQSVALLLNLRQSGPARPWAFPASTGPRSR